MLPDEGDDDPFHSSDHPNEPDLPGEDNAGERLIRKYDPTIDEETGRSVATEVDFGDASGETVAMFWYLVGVFNVALLALSIGLMIIGFLGRWELGGAITVTGAILAGYGYYRYRSYTQGRESADEDDVDGRQDDVDDGNG